MKPLRLLLHFNSIKVRLEHGFDDEDEAFEAWEGWCDDVADIDPESKDKFEYDVKHHFSLIF